MEWFFESGHAVDLVLVVLLAEFLLFWRVGRDPVAVFWMLAPAALMLLALRVALTGGSWFVIAGLLALSFPAHLGDLAQRNKALQSRP